MPEKSSSSWIFSTAYSHTPRHMHTDDGKKSLDILALQTNKQTLQSGKRA